MSKRQHKKSYSQRVQDKEKASKKYQKILDKAHSTHRSKETRKSYKRKHDYKMYDLEY